MDILVMAVMTRIVPLFGVLSMDASAVSFRWLRVEPEYFPMSFWCRVQGKRGAAIVSTTINGFTKVCRETSPATLERLHLRLDVGLSCPPASGRLPA
jgi:hypothetical protein